MRANSGGGIQSRVVKQSKAYKSEPVANKASPAGANQLGAATAFRKEPLIQQGKGLNPPGVGATGVPGYFNSAKAGPGSGRTIMKSGSQSQYGPVNPGEPRPAPRDILSEFGPEASGKR
jgi:hypothetical protein